MGISPALADYQPRRITRCALDRCSAAEAAQEKSSKPREPRQPHTAASMADYSRRLETKRVGDGVGGERNLYNRLSTLILIVGNEKHRLYQG